MPSISLFAKDIGIDLGTTNTLVYLDKKGIVLNEPSVVAIDINTGEIVSVGKRAYEMIGRTPKNIVAMKPLEHGVISDYEITQVMLKYFIDKSNPGIALLQSRVVVSIPTGITDVERRAVEDAVMQAGARDVLLVEEPIASAWGMGLDLSGPKGYMIINIGGGTTEVAVVSLGGIVSSKSVFIGGDRFNEKIIQLLKDQYHTMIGMQTAEEIKLMIGSVNEHREEMFYEVSGRDVITGLPINVKVSGKAIAKTLKSSIDEIIDGIRAVLERTPPELSADIIREGLYITGGSSRLDGLSELISQTMKMKMNAIDHPEESACLGTGHVMKQFLEIKKSRRRKD